MCYPGLEDIEAAAEQGATPAPLVAACPAGSRVKTSVLEDLLWVQASELCEQISWVATWMAPVCAQLLPRMVDLRDLCASEPDPLPEIDLVGLAVAGQLTALPQLVADWIWARWRQVNWETYCECNPVTGPGACPLVPAKTLSIVGQQFTAPAVLTPFDIGHSWTTMTVLVKAPGTNTALVVHDVQLLDAGGLVVYQFSGGSTAAGVTTTLAFTSGLMTQPQRDAVRTLRFQARNNSAGSITQSATVEVSAYTGPCVQDVTTIPPPPIVPPEPPVPDAPPMPPLPTGCTLDDLCGQLAAIAGLVGKLHDRVGVLQRYGLPFGYELGLVHAGLSGSGYFAIGSLVGFKVDLTSAIPGRVLEGQPQYLWDLGWLTINTADGMIEEKRFTRDPELWQPLRVQEARTFGYHFKAGVTATVTELTPVPY